jgi:hypothetical protein
MITEQSEAPLPREAYTLLAQANLLRMRGCWEEAVEKCMAALRLAPESASAQSLLGDIYENQGRRDDAIQWYRMALDISPDSPADRLKLGRLLEARPSHAGDNIEGELVRISPTTAKRAPSEAITERLLRGTAWLAAALFVLAAVLAGVVMSRRHSVPSPITAPPIVVTSSDTNTDGDTPEATATDPPTPSPSPTPTATTSPTVADPVEASLLQILQQDPTLTSQNILPEGVQVDPRQNAVTLTILCPTPTAGTTVRETLLRDAVLAGQAGTRAQGDRVGSWTIRCLAASTDSTATEAPDLAFVADTTTAALATLGATPMNLSPAQLEATFRNAWWSPAVPQ